MIENEDLIRLAEVSSLLPVTPDAKHKHRCTVWRWCKVGVRGIRLESTRVGGVRVTSRQAVARFLAALNALDNQAPPAEAMREHKRDQAAKVRELAAVGL